MGNTDGFSRGDVQRTTAEMAATQPKKLSTGEYRQALQQQYERMAQHQQIIAAECDAKEIR